MHDGNDKCPSITRTNCPVVHCYYRPLMSRAPRLNVPSRHCTRVNRAIRTWITAGHSSGRGDRASIPLSADISIPHRPTQSLAITLDIHNVILNAAILPLQMPTLVQMLSIPQNYTAPTPPPVLRLSEAVQATVKTA